VSAERAHQLAVAGDAHAMGARTPRAEAYKTPHIEARGAVGEVREIAARVAAPSAAGSASTGAPAQPVPAAPVKIGVGELSVYVEPWAAVYVNGRPVGQSPYRAKLPAGSYSVRMKNEDVDKDETVIVTVSATSPATVRRAW
jgi:hypothetical protein